MVLPYYLFALIYLAVIIGSLLFVGLNIAHMNRFGLFDFVGKANAILVLGVIVVILVLSVGFLNAVPWWSSFNLFSGNTV